MIPFKIMGEELEPQTVQVPTKWADITLGKYIEIIENPAISEVELIAKLCNVEVEALRLARRSCFDGLLSLLQWFYTGVDDYNQPDFTMVPRDLGEETIGQMESAKMILLKNKDKHLYCSAPYIYGIYMQKIQDGRFDEKKAMALAEEVKGKPITEVYGTCNFFFQKLNGYKHVL